MFGLELLFGYRDKYSDHWMEVAAILTLLFYFMVKRRGWKQQYHSMNNKAVLITGCDTGFGHELAKKLDKKGVTVFAGCLFPQGQGAQKLQESCSDKLQVIHLDVTKDEHVSEAVKKVTNSLEANNEELWAVVNNAGIATFGEMEWTPMEVFEKMFDVNAMGPVRVTKAFLPHLRKSNGRIIFVTSLAGYYTLPGVSAYSMSKHATVSLANAMRCEMKKWNISVHTISPTLYRTNISKELHNDINSFWNQLPENIKDEYGGTFFTKYQKTLRYWLKRSRSASRIHEVVDDMLDAVISHNPKTRYIPGLIPYIQNFIASFVPQPLFDMAINYGMPNISHKDRHLRVTEETSC